VKIPDYISPIVAYRVWRWDATGLKSLNGEQWTSDRPIEARCRVLPGTTIRNAGVMDAANELPHTNCTCGVYAAKNIDHLQQLVYADRGICGEAYLWGKVVEHRLGWRAQFAYPKNLVLPLHVLPFTLAEINARLHAPVAFGTDIFVLQNRESIRLWKHAAGYDSDGLDCIINLWQRHYLRELQERTLKKGDRVAFLAGGIAVVEQIGPPAAYAKPLAPDSRVRRASG
jgi:hypothetical protein